MPLTVEPFQCAEFEADSASEALREAATWLDSDGKEIGDMTFGVSVTGKPIVRIYFQ